MTVGINALSATPSSGLTRLRVLTAAIAVIDTEGLAGLTMRRLGCVLGVEAMAVYHYVSSRDDLLDGVAETLTENVADVTLPAGSTDWRSYLHLVATGMRDLLDQHPAVVPVLLTHPTSTQWWLRPPLPDSAWHQRFLATLRRCGFDQTAGDAAYRWFTAFLSGHLLTDSASVITHPLDGDRDGAQRRSALSRSDFDTSLAALLTRLAVLPRRIPLQRIAGID